VRLVVALAQHARVLAVSKNRCPSASPTGKTRRSAARPKMQSIIANSSANPRSADYRAPSELPITHKAVSVRAPRPGPERDQIRRRHQPIAVGMVLVERTPRRTPHSAANSSSSMKSFVHVMGAPGGFEQRRMDVDPDRGALLAEILGEVPYRASGETTSASWPPLLKIYLIKNTP